MPFSSPVRESEVTQSCPTPSDPLDCSLPGSSVHGIFQARVLEWGAITFSDFSSVTFNIKYVVLLHDSFNFGEGNGIPLQWVLAWRIPGMGEPDGLPSMGSHRVGHD